MQEHQFPFEHRNGSKAAGSSPVGSRCGFHAFSTDSYLRYQAPDHRQTPRSTVAWAQMALLSAGKRTEPRERQFSNRIGAVTSSTAEIGGDTHGALLIKEAASTRHLWH